ncbi:MAG: hypothetical protein GW772_06880 [Flavobacteriia bacterium]|nr:hypothetical protein [Flavobacteriia bacterium]OIP48172.1 MAG: hypothetical protein AUK46_02815 [Flavobacteriaceae bacterium CG2_30_31_66]PIV97877.1 MAG: hypothetical protein COW43_01090 [Flavobacteriaceae bacterium CG17_big_fil_post_rev_8_21_14_2_50_31_13]PIX14120.1 MAG: hypothetical protein COZ74_03905 [Flavobacteriaceae bacterium CG_4_8_14_3_um_filter_31_8]PIY14618.1 MAG: hypothetical protein COZ16_08540 [Flavobacteriaceae bacterium CG_4_10_14_3_um_filter_31_253]PIZ10885.1 MAG: hypotheti
MFTKKNILFFIFIFISKINFSQCAMCKAVVENGDSPMAEGVNDGITYLMIFPYLLIGILLYSLYRYKKTLQN